jgi:hypothetical protein
MRIITFIVALLFCGNVGSSTVASSSMFFSDIENVNLAETEITPKFTITGKVLTVKNLEVGAVIDIYSVLGAKIYSFTYAGTPVVLNLNKGMYVLKVDKFTQKIML